MAAAERARRLGYRGRAIDGRLVLGQLGRGIGAAEGEDVRLGIAVIGRDEGDILAAEQELDAKPFRGIVADLDHDCLDKRSEEHTSELQSLMRISYAVSGL